MKNYDLAIAYKWKYDSEFVELIEENFQKSGLTTFVIGKFNVVEIIKRIKTKEILFKAFLDRASDEDTEFIPLAALLKRKNCYLINPMIKVSKTIDKTRLHKKLSANKFRLPKTLFFPKYIDESSINIDEKDLVKIGNPFIIKPATFSGGGEGVIRNAQSFHDVQTERIKNRNDKYLVQEKIHPRTFNGRRAWFRVINAFGKIIPCWWDDHSHIYFRVTDKEIEQFNLKQLIKISRRLAKISRLDYFSTEIAVTKKHKFILIDYINDQCDMRLKSNHKDGVPDDVVGEFIESMKQRIIKF